jgi:hypothetical protein
MIARVLFACTILFLSATAVERGVVGHCNAVCREAEKQQCGSCWTFSKKAMQKRPAEMRRLMAHAQFGLIETYQFDPPASKGCCCQATGVCTCANCECGKE